MNIYLVKAVNPHCGDVTRITIFAPTVEVAEQLMDDFNPDGNIRDGSGGPIDIYPEADWEWIRLGTTFDTETEPRIVDYYHLD